MKKTLLTIFLTTTTLPMFSVNSVNIKSNLTNTLQKLKNQNVNLTKNVSKNNLTSLNPEYPNYTYNFLNSNTKHRTNRRRTKYGYQNTIYVNDNFDSQDEGNGENFKEVEIANIDINNYAKNANDFKDKYRQMELNFDLSYFLHNSTSITTSGPNNLSSFDNDNSYMPWVNKVNVNQSNYVLIFEKTNEGSNKHNVKMFYKSYFDKNNLKITIKTTAYLNYNNVSMYGHGAYIGYKPKNVKFISLYNPQNLKNDILNEMSKTITYKSYNGSTINSETTTGAGGEQYISNKKGIEELVLNKTIESFENRWNDFKTYGMQDPNIVQWDAKSNKVQVQLLMNNKEWLKFWTPINLVIDSSYNQISIQERMTISPSYIPDLKNPSSITEDNPEFKKTGSAGNIKQEFIYHNAVNISFKADTTKQEMLLVNGQEVEVYNDIFQVELLDNRDEKGLGLNTYKIELVQNKITELSINITIESRNPSINFQWLGWNPKEDGTKNQRDQWLLTQPTVNGEKNKLYDPTIDAKTGVRIQNFFVKEKPLIDPFLIDPKDYEGKIIKENDSNKESKFNYGYIAQAYVVNSGIKNIFNSTELSKIADVQRVKLNEKNLQEETNRESVDIQNEAQWSQKGLYHYIIYLNDYVGKKVDPKNPPIDEVLATKGTAIHKIIYIDNDKDQAYKKFSDLDFVVLNSNLELLENNQSGRNLKRFLIQRNILLDYQTLNSIIYEDLISYWRLYVSTSLNGTNPDTEITEDERLLLNDSPINFTINTTNINVAKEKIQNIITKELTNNNNIGTVEYLKDFYITNESGILLSDLDLSEFVNINEDKTTTKISLIVLANSKSLKIKGKTTSTVVNDNRFIEDKYLSLSDVKFRNFEYNFTGSQEEIKKEFLKNYIFNYIDKTLWNFRPKTLTSKDKYIYGEDYIISFNNDQTNIKNREDLTKFLNIFLNSQEVVSLKVNISAVSGSLLLGGFKSYNIINNPKTNVFPPINPDPDEPDPIIPPNNQKQSFSFWYIALIPILGLLIFIIYIFIKRIRATRKKGKINN